MDDPLRRRTAAPAIPSPVAESVIVPETVAVVGFTMEKVTIRLSNMMAFDADMFGNWGCMPEYYPAVVDKVLKNDINIMDTVEERPLDTINKTILLAKEHKLEKRVIFLP